MNASASRQSFLGAESDRLLFGSRVAVVGLGGGGSHIAQQLAHVGVGHFVLVDNDRIDKTNLNRLIGGTAADVKRREWKTAIAARQIKGLRPRSSILEVRSDWRKEARVLRDCDVVFGCLDSFAARRELEGAARRYLTPYIDIGMDVSESKAGYAITGQAVLSMPGHPCLQCMGVVTEARIAEEASKYGAAGVRPQVVWPNGVLASIAVGMFVRLVTPWHDLHAFTTIVEFDGKNNEVSKHPGLAYLKGPCLHHTGGSAVGDPWFRVPKKPMCSPISIRDTSESTFSLQSRFEST